MKYYLTAPPSKTPQPIEIDITPGLIGAKESNGGIFVTAGDPTVKHTITGTTPLDPVTPPVEPPIDPPSVDKIQGFGANAKVGTSLATVRTASDFSAALRSEKLIKLANDLKVTGRFYLNGISNLTFDANGYDFTINNGDNGDGFSVGSGSHHVFLKGMRVINAGNDCLNVIDGAHNVALINCTTHAGTDGGIDVAGSNDKVTHSVTIQNCIMFPNSAGEGSMLITAKEVSVLGCIFAHTGTAKAERSPMVHANYSPVGSPNVDFRNNLIWGHGRYGSGVGYKATGNFVDNYYYPGTEMAITYIPDGSQFPGKIYTRGNISSRGINLNDNGNSPEFTVPTWAKVVTIEAKEAARLALKTAGTAKKTTEELSWLSKIVIN